MTNLRKQIETLNNNLASQVPQAVLDIFGKSIADLKHAQLEARSAKLGDTLPSFALPNTKGKIVELDVLLEKYEKVVIAFFRGTWCPYCNLELRALQNQLTAIEGNSAKLVAIAPQQQEHNEKMVSDNALSFDVLTDANNAYAKQLGIDFELQDYARPIYAQMGIELTAINASTDYSLPMPAVFVVDKDKTVTYSFVDANYMERVDIDNLITNL